MEIDYLQLAIDEAWKYQFLTYPNPAVGAVLIVKNKVFISAHKKAGLPHAEVNVIYEAYKHFFKAPDLTTSNDIHNFLYQNHNNFFNDAILYVTLEPCNHYGKTPPCSLLIEKIKPKKVYIGLKDPISSHSGGIERLRKVTKVEVLNDKRCFDLIEPFIKWQNRFVFFKFAFSLNGVYEGGYITKKNSLKWVHKVRDKLDLIVIGGNTVRIDRPTLDSRLVNGKAPDILIYSKNDKFDRDIPLFKVKNRKVFISDNLDILDNYKFIMIEGGEKLYQALQNVIDMKLFIINQNRIIQRNNFKFNESLDIIHITQLDDMFLFARS
jgi:diaminohydroxyphosphoribosylaminopyrimidine deaminase/5-amino-6-(5-phosphoribosylamino)uracil reductase